MIPQEVVPIFFTLAGVQLARFTPTVPRWLLVTLLLLAAGALGFSRPAHLVPLAIGFVVSALWPLVIEEPAEGSRWRVGKPLLGLFALAGAIGVQAWLLEIDRAAIPAWTLDVALALLLLEPATRAVRLVLAVAGSPVSGAGLGPGEMIGVLERLIIFLLILADGYAAIGFVIAAKGLARYEKMKDENQAEYILLGTLASVFVVLLAGVAVRGHGSSTP